MKRPDPVNDKYFTRQFNEERYAKDLDDYINWLESKLKQESRETKIITVKDALVGLMEVVECCSVGPIVKEKYCPMCGKKISNPKQ